MVFKDGKMVTNETVSGKRRRRDGGARGTAEIGIDGTFRMKTEYLRGGKWQPARDAVYRQDATATVVFK